MDSFKIIYFAWLILPTIICSLLGSLRFGVAYEPRVRLLYAHNWNKCLGPQIREQPETF